MRLHQIKLEYRPEQDRILMRLSTSDAQEMLLWLTRRCVRLLWPALLKLAESSTRVVTQASPDARAALLGFEHEKAVGNSDFSTPYEDQIARARPLGSEPVLVSKIQTGLNKDGTYLLSLQPSAGQGLNLNLDDKLLHSVCKLLQSSVSGAEWDIRLEFPQALVPETLPGPASRTLN